MRALDEGTLQLASAALRQLPDDVIDQADIRAFDAKIRTSSNGEGAVQNKSAIDPGQPAIVVAVVLAAEYAREVLVQIATDSGADALKKLGRKLRPKKTALLPAAGNWTQEQLREVHHVTKQKLQATHGVDPAHATIVADGIVAALAMSGSRESP
jgi:hypothetical protein